MISACKFCEFGCYDLIYVNCALVFSVGPILGIYNVCVMVSQCLLIM